MNEETNKQQIKKDKGRRNKQANKQRQKDD